MTDTKYRYNETYTTLNTRVTIGTQVFGSHVINIREAKHNLIVFKARDPL